MDVAYKKRTKSKTYLALNVVRTYLNALDLFTTVLANGVDTSLFKGPLFSENHSLRCCFANQNHTLCFETDLIETRGQHNGAWRRLSVVNPISQWMSFNILCLNPSKTEFIIISLSARIKKIPDSSIYLSDNSSSTAFTSDAPVRKHGVTFDPQLSFSKHISNLSRSVTSAASDPCLTLKLPPTLPPPSPILN